MAEPRPPFGIVHWPGWLLVGLITATHVLLPRGARRRLSRGLGNLAWFFNRVPRRIAEINLQRCMPELDSSRRSVLIKEHFRLMAQAVWDYPLPWFGSRDRLSREVAVEGLDHLKAQRAKGRPVILMVAHTAGLDIAPPRLAMEVPMCGPYNPFGNALAEWLISHGRSRFGNQPIPRGAGMRGFLKALRGGGVLYYLADQDYGRERSQFVPFFGQLKATLPVIGRMAKASGAAVLPTMTVYDTVEMRYRVIIDPPLKDFPSGDPARDARRMNEALEDQIRRYPEHYMWTLKLFRTRPEGEPDWY